MVTPAGGGPARTLGAGGVLAGHSEPAGSATPFEINFGAWDAFARSWRTPAVLTPPKTMLFATLSRVHARSSAWGERFPLPIHSAVATKQELRESERFGGVVKII